MGRRERERMQRVVKRRLNGDEGRYICINVKFFGLSLHIFSPIFTILLLSFIRWLLLTCTNRFIFLCAPNFPLTAMRTKLTNRPKTQKKSCCVVHALPVEPTTLSFLQNLPCRGMAFK